MAHMVKCVKLGPRSGGPRRAAFRQRTRAAIYNNVSKLAWEQWQEHMKMLLNEYRLQPWKKEHQEFIVQQMEAYFFGEGAREAEGIRSAHPVICGTQNDCRHRRAECSRKDNLVPNALCEFVGAGSSLPHTRARFVRRSGRGRTILGKTQRLELAARAGLGARARRRRVRRRSLAPLLLMVVVEGASPR